MRLKLAGLGLAVCLAVVAQNQLTVKQLIEFVSSSIKLGHRDGRVASYLRDVTLSEQLDDRTIATLRELGAGPRTVDALIRLRDASNALPEAEPAEPEAELPPRPPPSEEEQQRVLDEVRKYAQFYSSQLPDFICVQVTRRYGDPSGLEIWHMLDTITTRLSYFEEKEDYQVVMINNRPVDLTMNDVGGSTSMGEFGTMLKEVFAPDTEATFQWVRWGKLRGRLTHVFEYRVRQDRSKWSIRYEKTDRVVPAYRGEVHVDSGFPQVLRLTLAAQNIPPAFPIQEARTVLDYDFAEISGQQHLLPLKFDMRMRMGRELVKNEVEFRLYRKFEADAVIKFDSLDPLPEEMTTEEPATPEQ